MTYDQDHTLRDAGVVAMAASKTLRDGYFWFCVWALVVPGFLGMFISTISLASTTTI